MAPQPEDTSDSAAVIEYLRLRLLASVAGSDRGFAVNKNQAAEIKEAAEALATAGGPVTLVYGAEGGEILAYCPTTNRCCLLIIHWQVSEHARE